MHLISSILIFGIAVRAMCISWDFQSFFFFLFDKLVTHTGPAKKYILDLT